MRLRYVLLALISLLVLTLLSGCGFSMRAVDDTTPAASSTTSSAIVPTPSSQPTGDPSPTTTQLTPSPTATVQLATTPTAANTAAPTVTPTPTPHSISPPPVSRPTVASQPPAPTPTPVPPSPTQAPESSAPNCADMPVRGFGLLWSSNPAVAHAVGCPLAVETGLSARVQLYQSGVMIWLDTLTPGIDQAPWVIALIGDSAARYRVPTNGPAWDEDTGAPAGAFKWVWDNVYSVQQSIGAALDPWYATDAAIQRFDHGTMLWLKQPPSSNKPMIFVFPDDLLNASTTTYQAYVDQGAQ